jgi:hypothetical protein
MTTPVSNANHSFYDPTAQYSAADACDATSTSCEHTAIQPASTHAEVTISPIVIGADDGAQQLVKGADAARRQPDCTVEANLESISCGRDLSAHFECASP